jgi:hypothetical protein
LEKEQKRKKALDKKYREAYKNFENIVDHIIKKIIVLQKYINGDHC